MVLTMLKKVVMGTKTVTSHPCMELLHEDVNIHKPRYVD